MKPARTIRIVLEEAMALHEKGETARAENMYREVLMELPQEPNAWHLLGVAAWQRNDLGKAEEYIRRAIGYNAKASQYFNNLAGVLKQKGDFAGAAEQYEKAFKLAPKDEVVRRGLAQTTHQLGMQMMEAKMLPEAKAAYHRVLELEPENFPTLNNLAMIVQHEGDRKGAAALYDRALAVSPNNLALRYNRSISYLTEGRFAEGWADFDASEPHWRPMQDERQNLPWLTACKLWDGGDLKDKKILVWGDQGIGDEIAYISMVPDLIARGAKVTIECMGRLVPLVARSFPEATVVARQSPPAIGTDFDYHAPGMWLARWLRPSFESFPDRRSFLKADPAVTARLRKKYQDMGRKRIVGISWFTLSPMWGLKRSMTLPEMLAPLWLKDMLIVDLQYANTADAWEEARRAFPDLAMIHDEEVDQFKDMDIFAAQVAACDYVVTISNTTSHVAGALGVPASILMPVQGLTWYWFENGEKCPWYPSLKLLRPDVPDRLAIAAREALQGR